MSQLLPFHHQGTDSGNVSGNSELSLSLDPSLSFTRKRERDCPTSESLFDGQNKRFHEFTDDQGPASETWEVKSSPPIPPGFDTDEDEIDIAYEKEDTIIDVPKRFLSKGSEQGTSVVSQTAFHTPLTSSQSYSLTSPHTSRTLATPLTSTHLPTTPIQKTSPSIFFSPDSPIKRKAFSISQKLSSTPIQMITARKIIAKAIDDGTTRIDLSKLDLDEIPKEIGDLKNLVLLNSYSGDPNIKIFLNHNNISRLPKELFSVRNVTVLSLRANSLSELPPSIYKLERLEDLSILQNNLRYLPSEMLELEKLQTFTYNANEFIQSDQKIEKYSSHPHTAYVHPSHPVLVSTSTANINFSLIHNRTSQSLVELCLDKISTHIISEREISLWNLSPGVRDLVSIGIDANNNGVRCGICHKGMTNGIGYVIEWWINYKKIQQELPFRRNLCSFRCYHKWNESIPLH